MSGSEAINVPADVATRSSEAAPELERLADDVARNMEDLISNGGVDEVADEAIQELVTAAIRLYVAKREVAEAFPPFAGEDLTATDVVVITTNLLRAANLEVFELTLWNGFGTM